MWEYKLSISWWPAFLHPKQLYLIKWYLVQKMTIASHFIAIWNKRSRRKKRENLWRSLFNASDNISNQQGDGSVVAAVWLSLSLSLWVPWYDGLSVSLRGTDWYWGITQSVCLLADVTHTNKKGGAVNLSSLFQVAIQKSPPSDLPSSAPINSLQLQASIYSYIKYLEKMCWIIDLFIEDFVFYVWVMDYKSDKRWHLKIQLGIWGTYDRHFAVSLGILFIQMVNWLIKSNQETYSLYLFITLIDIRMM